MSAISDIREKEFLTWTPEQNCFVEIWETNGLEDLAEKAAANYAAMQARIEKVTALVEKWRGEADPDGEVDQYDEEIRATYGTLLYCSNELQNALKGE